MNRQSEKGPGFMAYMYGTGTRSFMKSATAQHVMRQQHSAALIGTAMHEALEEFHVFADEYVVPSFVEAESRIAKALGYDPRNYRGYLL